MKKAILFAALALFLGATSVSAQQNKYVDDSLAYENANALANHLSDSINTLTARSIEISYSLLLTSESQQVTNNQLASLVTLAVQLKGQQPSTKVVNLNPNESQAQAQQTQTRLDSIQKASTELQKKSDLFSRQAQDYKKELDSISKKVTDWKLQRDLARNNAIVYKQYMIEVRGKKN